jgi:hypothetical protein
VAFEACLSANEVSNAHSLKAGHGAAPRAKTAPARLHEADCRQAALRLLASRKDSLALISVGASRASDTCEQLARAVAEVAERTVALLSLDSARIGESATASAGSPRGRWLTPSLALVAPEVAPAPGAALAALGELLRYAAPRASIVIADLSSLGSDEPEALAASHLFSGVALLVSAGSARERDVQRLLREIPEERNAGVLLVC